MITVRDLQALNSLLSKHRVEAELWHKEYRSHRVSLYDGAIYPGMFCLASMGRSYGEKRGVILNQLIDHIKSKSNLTVYVKEFNDYYRVSKIYVDTYKIVLKAEFDYTEESNDPLNKFKNFT